MMATSLFSNRLVVGGFRLTRWSKFPKNSFRNCVQGIVIAQSSCAAVVFQEPPRLAWPGQRFVTGNRGELLPSALSGNGTAIHSSDERVGGTDAPQAEQKK